MPNGRNLPRLARLRRDHMASGRKTMVFPAEIIAHELDGKLLRALCAREIHRDVFEIVL